MPEVTQPKGDSQSVVCLAPAPRSPLYLGMVIASTWGEEGPRALVDGGSVALPLPTPQPFSRRMDSLVLGKPAPPRPPLARQLSVGPR